MTYLIIGAVIIYLVGTAAWVLPSRREKKQMQMRLLAKKLGLEVKLKSKELPVELDRGYGNPYYMQYLKIREEPLENVKSLRLVKCGCDEDQVPGWKTEYDFDEEAVMQLQPLVKALPGDVFALILSGSAVAVEWQEKATLDDVEQVSRTLSAIENIIWMPNDGA